MPGRIRRDPRIQFLVFVLFLTLALVSKWLEPYLSQDSTSPSSTINEGEQEVLRVVDGDTLLLKKDRVRVRLQGIDTPETVKEDTAVQAWGPEATEYTKRFVAEAGGKLTFTIDGELEDRYGRKLRFVWNNDRLLNEELVAAGLARAKLGYDYSQSMKDRLRRAQDRARGAKLGIWGTIR
ncbi:thermonuclease family protein [Bythopirellula polymerisocia]|uniref:Thermonuclease n=1 Tax=Bythopirellula polymerisocia TaxID=2528003 RepID=A0A5C6CPY7_9BACT|nr:thermonuclease family protein [Bythopirellula polymerisocia]TWU26105.1 Thermonuclease precursor [Bythopirellula polymerisocia]